MNLFTTKNNQAVTLKDFERALEQVEAHKAKVLYVHSDMSFGTPSSELKRNELLKSLLDVILSTGIDDIIFSTFTFSFPNGVAYDVKNSKTLMGALNDYTRRDGRGVRSIDPIMSNVHFGKNESLVTDIGKFSCGENSTYHKISLLDDVKFLFFGIDPALCFTYSHFIEERLRVPYRYDRAFTGMITDANGETYEDTYNFFVRYQGVKAGGSPVINEASLANGSQKVTPCGDSFIYTYEKDRVEKIYVDNIKKDINFMLAEQPPKELIKEYIVEKFPVVAM